MAKLTKRHAKNIERMKSIVDGTFGGKVQVGYTPTEVERKVGET